MPRVYLPVLAPPLDRRVVLRGMGAALLTSLTGCATYVRDGSDEVAVDGGTTPITSFGVERCGTEVCIALADPANASLRAVDGSRVIFFENKRLLVIRLEQEAFLVLSAACTHNGCTVRYSPSSANIACPCHGSRFTLDGAVTEGPAGAPLATYASTYDPATDVVRVAFVQ